jgi:hypothetical protein
LNSPRYPNSVFIFGDIRNGVFEAVGTCFAISPQYLLTAQHNMLNRVKRGYAIVPYLTRETDGSLNIPAGYPREIEIKYFNSKMDYAVASLVNVPFDLSPIPVSLENIEADMDIKVYHCPVDFFNEEHIGDLTVFTSWTKTARPTSCFMRFWLVFWVVGGSLY